MNTTYPIKVSIIVPVYNAEKYLPQCLESLIGQTLKEIEIILVNDASIDQSGVLCDVYAENDSRIRVIHNKEKISQGPSRNKALTIAQGEYIGFVDADDWVDLDFYEKLYVAAYAQKADISKAKRIKVLPQNKKIRQHELNKKITQGLKKKYPLSLLFTYEFTSAIYKNELIQRNSIHFADLRNGEDDFFLLQIGSFAQKFSFAPQTFYYYRQNISSTTMKKDLSYYESVLSSYEKRLNFLNNISLPIRHYNYGFHKFSKAAIQRSHQLAGQPELVNYRTEYLHKVFNLMTKFTHLNENNLQNSLDALTGEMLSLKKSLSYQIGASITWLPRKLISFLQICWDKIF